MTDLDLNLTQRLTKEELRLHRLAKARCRLHERVDWKIVEVLQDVEKSGFYKKLERRTINEYANFNLDLSQWVANAFVAVARKAIEYPALQKALRQRLITVSIAIRLVGALNPANADELIVYACTHSKNDTEREIKRVRGKDGNEEVKILYLPESVHEKIRRANSLRAQCGHIEKLADTVNVIADPFLDPRDPVRKAGRACRRHDKKQGVKCAKRAENNIARAINQDDSTAQSSNPPSSVAPSPSHPQPIKRTPPTAFQKHQVNLRDGGRCRFVDNYGNRCESDRYIHHHHIIPWWRGGSNEPENLISLCWFHHDLVHRIYNGRVPWVQAPVQYGQYGEEPNHKGV